MFNKNIFLFLLIAIFASCATGRRSASSSSSSEALQNEVIQYGRKFLGKPYRYAAKGPNSFDCSGYTSFVFKKFGYNLSPSSSEQDNQTVTVRSKNKLRKSDLVFFEGRKRNGRVGHVGIVTDVKPNGDFSFIHASTSNGVIVSKSTEPYYSSRYLRGGRVIRGGESVVEQSLPKELAASNSSKKENKKMNAYQPAKRKKEPKIPVVTPEKSVQDTPILVQNEELVVVAENLAELDEPSQVIIVQTDSTKTPRLTETNTQEEEKKTVVKDSVQNAIVLRKDSVEIPEPVVQLAQDDDVIEWQNHTVKPGETLYSISKKYNCTVEELRVWNPQMNQILKTGEILNVRP